jgi:hypothetical protein
MKQRVAQFHTFPEEGRTVADRINVFLAAYPGAILTGVYPILVDKIGGPEHEVLAVFETRNEEDEEDRPRYCVFEDCDQEREGPGPYCPGHDAQEKRAAEASL